MRISDWSSDVCSSDLIVPGDRLPVLWRDDYVQNSNDSAWLSNPEAPLTGYPAIVSEEGVVQGGRTRMGIAQIEARLAGTDGRPGTTFDAATLRDIALSNRVFFGGLLREDIRTLCRVPGSVTIDDAAIDLTTACATLTGWDGLASPARSEEHTSELQSLMRISYAVFCLKKKQTKTKRTN